MPGAGARTHLHKGKSVANGARMSGYCRTCGAICHRNSDSGGELFIVTKPQVPSSNQSTRPIRSPTMTAIVN